QQARDNAPRRIACSLVFFSDRLQSRPAPGLRFSDSEPEVLSPRAMLGADRSTQKKPDSWEIPYPSLAPQHAIRKKESVLLENTGRARCIQHGGPCADLIPS